MELRLAATLANHAIADFHKFPWTRSNHRRRNLQMN